MHGAFLLNTLHAQYYGGSLQNDTSCMYMHLSFIDSTFVQKHAYGVQYILY